MDRHQRLAILAEAAADDREHGLPKGPNRAGDPVGITRVRLPGGGSTSIMRVMQTNACSLSCGYCPTFCGGEGEGPAPAAEGGALPFLGGPKAAMTLARERGRGVIRGLSDLRRAGVDASRAGYFLLLGGRRLAPAP